MDWTPIRDAFLSLVLPGLGALLLAALFALVRTYIARIHDERLRAFLIQLVAAAEQIYGPRMGAEKRAYVLDRARASGLATYQDKELRSLVEGAVYDLNERQRLLRGNGS